MPMSGADSLFLNCNEKPLIHFSLPPFIHQVLKAQCCLGSGLFLGRGDLQMLQPPCWDSASSHTGQAVTWLAPLSYLSFSLFLYPDVSHDSNPGYLTRSLSWQTDHLPGSLNTIAYSYQGPVENRHSLGLGLYYLLTLITESHDLSLQSQPAQPQVSFVLLTGQNLHVLQRVSAHADWMQSHLLLTLWIPTAQG